MGHKSRDAGSSFEKRVQGALVAAQQAGVVAWWSHQHPLMNQRGTYVGQTGADFVLVLVGGTSGAIEAKSVKGASMPRDRIEPEQARHLTAVARERGVALLALEFVDEERGAKDQFLVPWDAVPWKLARTSERVYARDLSLLYRMRPMSTIENLVEKCHVCRRYGLFGRGCCQAPF